VLRIEEKLSPLQEYESRLANLDEEDAEGHYQLALFCKENGLKSQERDLYEKTLAIDSQHEGANRAVGNVLYEGLWMTPEEKAWREKDAKAAEMRARGLVEHEGRWVTPEEKENLEKGLVLHDGRWMTPDQVKEAEGYVKWKGQWVKKEELERKKLIDTYGARMEADVNAAVSEHFAAVGPFEDAQLREICETGEKAYDQFCEIMGVDPDENLFVGQEEDEGRTRCHIVYSRQKIDYVKLVDGMRKRYPKDITEPMARLMKSQKGFYFVYPSCYVIGCLYPNTFEQLRAAVVHKTSHVLLMRYRYASGFFPWWLIEGLGTYQEISLMGRCDTFCITVMGYAAPEGDPANKWPGMARWKDVVRSQVVANSARTLNQLSRMALNDLDMRDLAKCWSLVEWFLREDRAAFVRLVDLMKAKVEFREAVRQAFGKPTEQLDKEWREYVKATY
jgi:hypothetical protein